MLLFADIEGPFKGPPPTSRDPGRIAQNDGRIGGGSGIYTWSALLEFLIRKSDTTRDRILSDTGMMLRHWSNKLSVYWEWSFGESAIGLLRVESL